MTAGVIRLLADFVNVRLISQSKELPPEALELEGAAYLKPGEGLAVYKGGVNEIIDPSFEGSGWELHQGAEIDPTAARRGNKSLRIEGKGSSGVVARLREKIPVVAGQWRTLTCDHDCSRHDGGAVNVTMSAYGPAGESLGKKSASIDAVRGGWQRTTGFTYDLPPKTASYDVEISTEDFTGVCHLDGFLSECRDYPVPYYDGDSQTCGWVKAATPQHAAAAVCTDDSRRLTGRGLALASAALRTAGLRGPGLVPNTKYFYRVTSVDDQGNESPASVEVRARTDWLNRKVTVSWNRDPSAVKYRIYRGVDSHAEHVALETSDAEAAAAWQRHPRQASDVSIYDVAGNTALFVDEGHPGAKARPPVEIPAGEAVPHASVSLRPDPDVRISNSYLGLDALADFWVAGEVVFGFRNGDPYKPASFFEIGDPRAETCFAVSTRFMPKWGDDSPKILLMKKGGNGETGEGGQAPYADEDRIPVVDPGSVVKYLAAQLYRPQGNLKAGVHLWYRIDEGEMGHIEFANTEPLAGTPVILISKRYFYDFFGNNSLARSFAIIQGAIEERIVESVLAAGPAVGHIQGLFDAGNGTSTPN